MGRESNKQRRQTNAASAREKAAAARAEQQRAEQRQRAMRILGGVVAAAVVIAVIAVVALTHKSSASNNVTPVAAAVISDVDSVSAQTIDAVGAGTSAVSLKPINGKPLTVNGKPEFLYIGAEFCPFCAAERWSMAQALSRFGTLSGVGQIQSSEDNFSTFDFKDAAYTSKYLVFTPREIEDQNRAQLQSMTSEQAALFKQDSPGETFPFLYLGGKYVQNGAGYDPTILTGLSHAKIASELDDPTSPVSKAVVGEANVLTAGICGMTNNQPSNVCSTSTISALQKQINSPG